MTESGKSFWQTTTGLITAVATLVTAVGGLLGILIQNGIIGGAQDGKPAAAVSTGAAGEHEATPEVTPGPPPETPAVIPWNRATVTLLRKDGTSATVKAPTVGLACNPGVLKFENGQTVSLELVRSIQFDAIFLENSSADGAVTLLDGRELTDPIDTWNCPVSGTNELGPVQIKLEDIKRIDFHR